MKDWKKTKSCTISDAGYHKYFALSSSALSNDAEFEVKEDATKAQIKSAFTKSLKGKKMNKKVLGEFIELIAWINTVEIIKLKQWVDMEI